MKNNVENLISQNFETEIQNLKLPAFSNLTKGIHLIEKRKPDYKTESDTDFYYFIAKFLNLKIKMYQVLIVFAIVLSTYLYYSDSKIRIANGETKVAPIEITIPANSYTVMACVKETKTI